MNDHCQVLDRTLGCTMCTVGSLWDNEISGCSLWGFKRGCEEQTQCSNVRDKGF